MLETSANLQMKGRLQNQIGTWGLDPHDHTSLCFHMILFHQITTLKHDKTQLCSGYKFPNLPIFEVLTDSQMSLLIVKAGSQKPHQSWKRDWDFCSRNHDANSGSLDIFSGVQTLPNSVSIHVFFFHDEDDWEVIPFRGTEHGHTRTENHGAFT